MVKENITAENGSAAPAIVVNIDNLHWGTRLELETENRTYEVNVQAGGYVLISGHPRHCPEPVMVRVCPVGASSGLRCLSVGTRLKYFHPGRGFICTSPIRRIRNTGYGHSIVHRLA